MAKYHELESKASNYVVADIVVPLDDNQQPNERATYRFLKLTTEEGSPVFQRFVISTDDIDAYPKGKKLELHAWSMNIIPVKIPDRNKPGEFKTLRTVSGLCLQKTDCERNALRAAQRLYDTAEYIANNAEILAIARTTDFFADFVDRAKFMQLMNGED